MPNNFDRRDPPYDWIGWLEKGVEFTGCEGGAVTIHLLPTTGARSRRALVVVNEKTAGKIAEVCSPGFAYEDEPEAFERKARQLYYDAAPELARALAFGQASNVVLQEVHGLPAPLVSPLTPINGRVVEAEVPMHVAHLIGGMAGSCDLAGIAYRDEQPGLLRAVAPVGALRFAQNSQGYDEDLRMHQDNAPRPIWGVPDTHPGAMGPMNNYQSFVAVRPSDPPMEVVSLADVVAAVTTIAGGDIVDQMQRPDYAVDRPHAQGGGQGVIGVPLLIRDMNGCWHGRFHAGNVRGVTPVAQKAFESFRKVLEATRTNVARGNPGSLLLYSNTRAVHRRDRFVARFDRRDRFWIRCYLVPRSVLAAYAVERTGRVFN